MAPAHKRRGWQTLQVARYLNCSAENVRRLERKGDLRATRTETGTRIFRPEQVERYAREREAKRAQTNATEPGGEEPRLVRSRPSGERGQAEHAGGLNAGTEGASKPARF